MGRVSKRLDRIPASCHNEIKILAVKFFQSLPLKQQCGMSIRLKTGLSHPKGFPCTAAHHNRRMPAAADINLPKTKPKQFINTQPHHITPHIRILPYCKPNLQFTYTCKWVLEKNRPGALAFAITSPARGSDPVRVHLHPASKLFRAASLIIPPGLFSITHVWGKKKEQRRLVMILV